MESLNTCFKVPLLSLLQVSLLEAYSSKLLWALHLNCDPTSQKSETNYSVTSTNLRRSLVLRPILRKHYYVTTGYETLQALLARNRNAAVKIGMYKLPASVTCMYSSSYKTGTVKIQNGAKGEVQVGVERLYRRYL